MTFARKQDAAQVKSLNAKKLDIDFGANDDFFNSFQPVQEKKQTNKLVEVKDPFSVAEGFGNEKKDTSAAMNFGYGQSQAGMSNE